MKCSRRPSFYIFDCVKVMKKQRYYLVFILALLISLSAVSAETRIRFADIAAGTEAVTIVPNGDFAGGETGWNRIDGDMIVAGAPEGASVPAGTGPLAISRIAGNSAHGQYRRDITLEGDTEYVLSARMWELGDDNHHVDVVVVDLNDAGLWTPDGIWEGQLTLYPDTPDGQNGYFIYDTFTTPPGPQTVTLRLFYTGLYETDDNWPITPFAAMWDNIAVTPADQFAEPLPDDPTPPDTLTGDLDTDGDVDFDDLVIFTNDWPCYPCDTIADLDDDRRVNLADYSKLAANWKISKIVAPSTLHGKIMCGYQGWFNCSGDGAGRGWVHWGRNNKFEPGFCTVDWWPDMSEYDADEKYPTGFNYADGSTAYVFSSHNEKTVLRHFSWMAEYGIDGIFLQRFATETNPGSGARDHRDQVMLSCREGANLYKRAWAMMYDLSGLDSGTELKQKVESDWKHLVDTYGITKDPTDAAYLHHNGKPVVAVWGLGFGRAYEGRQSHEFIEFLKNDPTYGGCTVMIGVQNSWRTNTDTWVRQTVDIADIISPWAVGRYGSKNTIELDNFTTHHTIPDQDWCDANGKDYLPVVFPGFSWQNLKGEKWDHIPRLGGSFLWRQIYKAIAQGGATMIYQAMFDEVDEGTAIFKCTNDPPVAEAPLVVSTPFLPTGNASYPPYDISDAQLPSDHYLRLVGQAGRMLRGEIEPQATMPARFNR